MADRFKHDGDLERGTHLASKLIPLLFQEGFSIDHAGNQVLTWHVDFRMPDKRTPIGAVIKYGHKQFAIERSHTVKLAKPSSYRQEGETLIHDKNEGLVTKETVVQREVSLSAVEDANRALELSGERGINISTALKNRTVTDTERDSLEWGNDMWLFCTAMEPTSGDESKALVESLDPDYDYEYYVPSPRTFAQVLARTYLEGYGAPHKEKPMEHAIGGVFAGKTYHRQMIVVHGPVVYVDDPYATCTSAQAAQNPLIRTLLPIFIKGKEYSGQREYRFVVPDKRQHEADWKIMPATPELLTAVGRRGGSKGPMSVPDFDTSGTETVPPSETTDLPHNIPSPPKPSITRRDLAEISLASSTIPDSFRAVNEEEPTNDFHETVGLYPAVTTLHEKIDGVWMGIAATQPERKPYLTSAAWYAERSIRKLCHRFENPIAGISVTEDNSIVIDIRLSHWHDSECRLAVMPSGVYALTLKRKNGDFPASHYSFPMAGDHDFATSLNERELDTIADYEPR